MVAFWLGKSHQNMMGPAHEHLWSLGKIQLLRCGPNMTFYRQNPRKIVIVSEVHSYVLETVDSLGEMVVLCVTFFDFCKQWPEWYLMEAVQWYFDTIECYSSIPLLESKVYCF